ncbi:MAG: hypothetical protein P8Y40_01280, partial [Desulfobacterales bacterium]
MEIQNFAVEYIAGALHKVSPGELRNVLSNRYSLSPREAAVNHALAYARGIPYETVFHGLFSKAESNS